MKQPASITDLKKLLTINPRYIRRRTGVGCNATGQWTVWVTKRKLVKTHRITRYCRQIRQSRVLGEFEFCMTKDDNLPDNIGSPRINDDSTDAFAIECRDGCIVGCAASENGLRYALTAVVQLLDGKLRKWPAFVLRDKPALEIRAVMVDVARQVEKFEYLKSLVDRLAEFRCNMLMLYFQNRLAFSKHPKLRDKMAYSLKQMEQLGRYAHAHGIELVPMYATFGHCEDFLKIKEYQHLADGNQIYQFDPLNKQTQQLLKDMFDDWPTIEGNRHFHIACDEAPYYGNQPSTRRYIEKHGLDQFFANHINFMHRQLKKRGLRVMLWGDMLRSHPGVLDLIPKDIIINEWNYDAIGERDEKAIDLYQSKGFEVMVAPAASRSAQLHFPLHRQIKGNIPSFVELGVRKRIKGALICQWECFTRFSRWSEPGFMLGLMLSWEGKGFTNRARRQAAYGWALNGDGQKLEKAIEQMSPVLLIDRFKSMHSDPEVLQKTYHLDTHELCATDPLIYLKYRHSSWEKQVAKRFEAGAEYIRRHFASNSPRDRMLRFSADSSLFLAWKRTKINETGLCLRQAAQLHGRGDLDGCIKCLLDAINKLKPLKKLAGSLDKRAAGIWAIERYGHDPAFERLFGRRFSCAVDGLDRLASDIRREMVNLRNGQPFELDHLLGDRRIYCFKMSLPNSHEVNILRLDVSTSDNGKKWKFERMIGAFQKPKSVYYYQWMPLEPPAKWIAVELLRTQALWDFHNLHIELYRLSSLSESMKTTPSVDNAIITQEFNLLPVCDRSYKLVSIDGQKAIFRLSGV